MDFYDELLVPGVSPLVGYHNCLLNIFTATLHTLHLQPEVALCPRRVYEYKLKIRTQRERTHK